MPADHRAQRAAGADLYTLHARALADLQPDLIVTQDLCRGLRHPSGQVEQALADSGRGTRRPGTTPGHHRRSGPPRGVWPAP